MSNIGPNPGRYARDLFGHCASLTRENHRDELRLIGMDIYDKTPIEFRRVYWFLRDRLGPHFSIQFVSDDPYIPWELMLPYSARDDDRDLQASIQAGQREGPADILAIDHPVARWFASNAGSMTSRIPDGRLVTIAPAYPKSEDELESAQAEARRLRKFKAKRIKPATRANVRTFMKDGLPGESVAIVHFAGHGAFNPRLPGTSSIDLEDGPISAAELKRLPIGLALDGRPRPLVVFNACETGNTAAVLGQVGGWAEVFVDANCSGFVAPLWRVDDAAASDVVVDLVREIRDGKPVGQSLQALRVQPRASWSGFIPYLFYGDVMARVSR